MAAVSADYDCSMEPLHPLQGLEPREDDELQRLLRRHARELSHHEAGVRLEDADELHKQRVAARRLRSLLRSASGHVVSPARSQRLIDELRWLGDELGEVRDRDVLIGYLLGELATIEEAPAFGAILELLDAERELARKELIGAYDSPRFRALVEDLEHPPALADGKRLETAAAAEYERLRRIAERLAEDPADDDLHHVRIAVKRARYAAEAVDDDSRFVRHAKEVQELLGEHRDAVVAERRIRELLARVRGAGRTSVAAGRLFERQRAKRSAARAAWPRAWRRLRRAGDYWWR